MVIIAATDKYEYSSSIELDAISGNYFVIPSSIILETNLSDKRSTVFSFFSIRRGLDSRMLFSINNIVKWMGKQPNRHSNGINNKIIQIVEHLKHQGYLTLSEEITNSSYMETEFNLSKISQECEHERFAVVYLDELQTILEHQSFNSKDAYLSNDILLLVFAYLRMKIFKRRNKLFPEEINIDNKNNLKNDIAIRKLRSPEAYDCYYFEIAKELGLSPRTISKAVSILSEMGLIYSEALPRIKYENKWRTDHTIFCNTYKREGSYLLANGIDYYLTEIANKKKKLNIIDNRKDTN